MSPVLVLTGVIFTVTQGDPPAVDCGAQVEIYVEQLEKHPQAVLALPESSPVEEQCQINDLLDSLREASPDNDVSR